MTDAKATQASLLPQLKALPCRRCGQPPRITTNGEQAYCMTDGCSQQAAFLADWNRPLHPARILAEASMTDQEMARDITQLQYAIEINGSMEAWDPEKVLRVYRRALAATRPPAEGDGVREAHWALKDACAKMLTSSTEAEYESQVAKIKRLIAGNAPFDAAQSEGGPLGMNSAWAAYVESQEETSLSVPQYTAFSAGYAAGCNHTLAALQSPQPATACPECCHEWKNLDPKLCPHCHPQHGKPQPAEPLPVPGVHMTGRLDFFDAKPAEPGLREAVAKVEAAGFYWQLWRVSKLTYRAQLHAGGPSERWQEIRLGHTPEEALLTALAATAGNEKKEEL